MRTAIIIVGGLVLLALALLVARMVNAGPHTLSTVAKIFVEGTEGAECLVGGAK